MKLENFVKKIPISEYDNLPAMRSTSLKHFIRSPGHYKYSISSEAREENDGKSYFLLGRLVHAALLEPETVKDEFVCVDATTRNTNVFKETVKRNPGKGIILSHELTQANAIVSAVRGLPHIEDILTAGTPELSAAAMIDGVYCKCRMDLFDEKTGHIYDIKTTAETADKFPYVISKYGYDVSLAFYIDILLANKMDISGYTFIVVEKEPPYGTMLYTIDEEYLEYGRAKYQPALQKYRECLKSGVYPSYDSSPVVLKPPKF